MKRFIAYFALIIFICQVYAAPILQMESETGDYLPYKVLSCEMDSEGLTLQLQPENMSWATSGDMNQEVQYAEFPGAGLLEEEGYPLVPVAGRLFRIPPTSGVRVELIEAEYETVSGVDYATFYGELDLNHLDRSLTTRNEWYPADIVEVSEPAILHDFRVSRLKTFPVQVNTALREARVYNNIQVRISFEGEDYRNALAAVPSRISEAYLPWYRLFLDWNENELDNYTLYRGHVQVVMENDDVLMNAMEPWFEWKKQKGWEIDLLTDDDVNNWTNGAIRDELMDRYENAETKFDYVVLVGTNFGGSFNVPGYEHEYARLAGNDFLLDVAVGRIYVENLTHVQLYVNKVLNYERDVDMDNTDWYKRAVVTVSVPYGISGVFLGRYLKHALFDIGYTSVDTAWCNPYGNQDVNMVTTEAINNGVSFYSCRGTGVNVGGLTNTGMTPFVMVATCGSSFGSIALMQAGTVANPRGAIGATGISGGGTQVRFNVCLEYGGGFSMLVLRNRELGQQYFGSHINLWNNYEAYDDGISYYYNNFALAGDPTVWVWTDIPREFEVNAPENLEIGDNSTTFTVTIENEPVEDAWVTLYKVDQDEELICRGISDVNGEVILEAPFRYTGDAMLTITKQNCAPLQVEIPVVAAESRVGYNTVSLLDDGSQGSEGNGNGIAEAGETVGLQIEAFNFGESAETEISATVSCEDVWITDITGNIDYGTINSQDYSDGEGIILVQISPETQNDWEIPINIEFSTSNGVYSDNYNLQVKAPEFVLVEIEDIEDLEPGENANIQITLANIGGSHAVAGQATLSTEDQYLSIPIPTANIPATRIGQESTTADFMLAGHQLCVPGYVAITNLIITTEDGQIDTTVIPVPIGRKGINDPSGPDRYGYYAFEDTDVGYDFTPTYDWVEISLSEDLRDYNGTNLEIFDNSDDDDGAVCIPVDFPITYYGVEFNEVTVSANGMMAMGRQNDRGNSRNFIIPSPSGPNYMIAPYWDERTLNNNSDVYSYYDEENGRFIIEWYQVKDYVGQNPCTFEVIFYSQEAIPTLSENNIFTFQYHTLNHTRGTEWDTSADVFYWTTGIENGDQTDGLLLAYWNHAYSGAHPLSEGRAILFSADAALITGSIEGTVTDLETGFPVEGAFVHTDNYNYFGETDEEGFYHIDEVIIGSHILVVDALGYNSGHSIEEVLVFEDQVATVDFALTHPEFECSRDSLLVVINPDTSQSRNITLTNHGNGPLDYSFNILFHDPVENEMLEDNNLNELDDRWDPVFDFELVTEESRNRGVTYFDDAFWICGSVNTDGVSPNKIYRYHKNGDFIADYDQPQDNFSSAGFYGICSDGTYIYGADRGVIYQLEFTGFGFDIVNSWDSPYNNVRCITYDPDHALLWLGEYESSLTGVDLEGNVVYEFNQEFYLRGLGYNCDDEDDMNLLLITRHVEEENTTMIRMNPETGECSDPIDYPVVPDGYLPLGSDVTNVYNPLIWTLCSVLDGGDIDKLQIYEINLNTAWINIDPMSSSVPEGQAGDITVTIYSENLPLGDYQAWLKINHNSIEQTCIIPMDIIVSDTWGINGENELPYEWKFDGAYPNPFNPTVSINFTLKEAVPVKVKIFNLIGQEVAEIADNRFEAGAHKLTFNGSNLSSGIYFLQLDAGPLKHSQKLVLLK